jgi:pyroglutamyl-peptidase
MPTILLTAFEPFAGANVNPSAQVVRAMLKEPRNDVNLVAAILPVIAAELPRRLRTLIEEQQPDAILSLGEARGRDHISVEKRAVNLLEFREDNAGASLANQPVIAGGREEYRSTINADLVAKAISFMGTRCVSSNSCGTFCCNQVLYLALHHGAHHRPGMVAGFIHLPSLPEQRVFGRPPEFHMPLPEQVAAIREAIKILNHQLRNR